MNLKSTLALFCLITLVHNVAGQGCADVPLNLRSHEYFFGWRDNNGNLEALNYRISNATIQTYLGQTTELSDGSFTCHASVTSNPTTHVTATRVATGDLFCFEFHGVGSKSSDPSAYLLRKEMVPDTFDRNSAINCQSVSSVGSTFEILIKIDLSETQNNGFTSALDSGECSNSFPDVKDRPNTPNANGYFPEDYTKSLHLQTSIKDDDTTAPRLCLSDSSETTVDREARERLHTQACSAVGIADYYRPLGSPWDYWYCIGHLNGNLLNAGSDANVQLVALQDPNSNRWHFACMRLGTRGSCLTYSLELTDQNRPVCSTVYGANNDTVDQNLGWRDPDDNTNKKGFISFEACSTDCADGRCRNVDSSKCTQFLGRFECDCPRDLDGVGCEVLVKQCDSNPCQNNGNCEELPGNDVTGYRCNCPRGFSGTHCEIEICDIHDDWQKTWFNKYVSGVSESNRRTLVFQDRTTIVDNAETFTYTCELDMQSGNIWTATILRQGFTDQRRCIQVIPMTQQLPNGAEGEMFLLFRALDKISATEVPPTSQECQFLNNYQVLIRGDLTQTNFVSAAPFPAGNDYSVEWNYNNAAHCVQNYASTATIVGNSVNLGGVCDTAMANNNPAFSPIGHTMHVVHYFEAAAWGGSGNVMLVAVDVNDDMNNPAFTYYCAYWSYDNINTIHISMNLANQLVPECVLNGNPQQTGTGLLFIKLVSNVCNGGDGNTKCRVAEGGECRDVPNQSHECTCPAGYRYNDAMRQCDDIDECAENPCSVEGTHSCTHGVNTRTCNCKLGWSHGADGDCTVSDNCAITTEQCENGATCVNIEKVPGGSVDGQRGYRCDCAAGWIDGSRSVCEVDKDECQSNPCQNGATCSQDDENGNTVLDHYRCICPSGYTGTNCERERNNCETNNPCLNDGICVNYAEVDGGIYCDCTDTNYIWQFCQEVNECKTQPCHAENTVSCEDRRGERVCHCKEGFMGGEIRGRPPASPFDDCSRADTSNPCYTKPCKNEGVCQRDGERFTCSCSRPFSGPTCQERMITCADNPCPSGIGCTPMENGTFAYKCDCPPHLTGQNCENKDDGLGIVEQTLIGILCALIVGCAILAACLMCGPKAACAGKGGCCP